VAAIVVIVIAVSLWLTAAFYLAELTARSKLLTDGSWVPTAKGRSAVPPGERGVSM
jgi:hypothetical protein